MKKLLLSFFMCMLAIIGMQAETATATLSFADKAQRTSFSTDKQVWEQNGITFTNNKNTSSTAVADYANPVRLYAGSEIVIEFGQNMTEIQFTCSENKYVTPLQNVITEALATTSVSSKVVTATLKEPSKSITIVLGAQVRLSSITVTYDNTGGGGEVVTVEVPTFTPESGTEFEGSLDVTIDVAEGLEAYYSTDNGVSFTPGTTVTITETTTIIAYAQDSKGNKSNRVSAKYTKNEPLPANTIVFNNTEDGGDSNTEAETSNFVTTYIKETNIEGLTCTATSKCYKGKTDYGIKMGSSKGNGTFTLQLASAMNVESIVVNAVNFGNDVATLSVNGSDAQLTAQFANYTFEINDEISTIKVDMTNRGYIKSLTIKLVENITAGEYYLKPGSFENETCALYAIKFINKNTDAQDWKQGYLNDGFVSFKIDNDYTHMEICVVKNLDTYASSHPDYPQYETANVLDFTKSASFEYDYRSGELEYEAPTGGDIKYFDLDLEDWVTVDPIATGVNRVEMAGGIGYAYGVVSAEGAIEVYNVNGAVVARGNDTIDLRGLGRGVYIIRNGNQVRKVVR